MIKEKNKLFTISILSVCVFILSCGTLGGIGDGIYFPTSKNKLEVAMDSLYLEHPEYKIPEEWKKYNDWSDRGYTFLESRIFYFKSQPTEMYYVTFIGDSTELANTTKIGIGIRAVFPGHGKWLLENNITTKEKERIKKRFYNEIVFKLEKYTKTNVSE